jgi:hypothetical protein
VGIRLHVHPGLRLPDRHEAPARPAELRHAPAEEGPDRGEEADRQHPRQEDREELALDLSGVFDDVAVELLRQVLLDPLRHEALVSVDLLLELSSDPVGRHRDPRHPVLADQLLELAVRDGRHASRAGQQIAHEEEHQERDHQVGEAEAPLVGVRVHGPGPRIEDLEEGRPRPSSMHMAVRRP